jgi:hypothetical protein
MQVRLPDNPQEFQHPDQFYGYGSAITFICGDVLGKYAFLYHVPQSRFGVEDSYPDLDDNDITDEETTHINLILAYAAESGILDRDDVYNQWGGIQQGAWRYRNQVERTALLGRQTGSKMSFWNEDKTLYNKYLPKCFAEIKSKIPEVDLEDQWITTPLGSDYYENILDNLKRKLPDNEEDLRTMLRLARGDEKKDIMRKLGMWDRPSLSRERSRAWRRSAGAEPWRIHSDWNLNFKEWLK